VAVTASGKVHDEVVVGVVEGARGLNASIVVKGEHKFVEIAQRASSETVITNTIGMVIFLTNTKDKELENID
jgi:hypothetical protein